MHTQETTNDTQKEPLSDGLTLPRIRLQMASCESLHTVHIPTPVCRPNNKNNTLVIIVGLT